MLGRIAMRAARSSAPARLGQVRRMGGGHAHVEYTGMEKTIRHYLPEDHHIVLANLGVFFGGIFIWRLTSSSAPEEPAAPAPVAVASTGGDVPSLLDESFEEFIKTPGAAEKWEKSVEDWANAKTA